MTLAQWSYLKTLAREAGDDFDPDIIELTQAEVALRIEELQRRTGRMGSG